MSGFVTKMLLDDDLSIRKGIASTLNYSRDQLLEFGKCKAAKEPPKMFDFSGADDKRIEKIRHVLKNSSIWKSLNKNGDTVTAKGGAAQNNEQARRNFQQMIADANSDEPEWANCGPISKHDIIELHGFDGPDDDDGQKTENAMPLPPVRNSTPSKMGTKKVAADDHFNFEDFLKLDLPPSVNCSRNVGTGESRFSQWFGRDKPSHAGSKFTGNAFDTKSTQQFFDYHQKANQKKMNAPNKVRSVNELEAAWCPPNQAKQTKPQQPDINTIRNILNHLATQPIVQKHRTMTSDQTNFLLSLINKRAENLYQYRLSQNAIMKRPDAQLLLHRLVNGETTQLHILQQLSNVTIHQRDRETLLAVFNFCNENQQWLLQQQEQQKKHKEQMSQQFRQLQMIHMIPTYQFFN